MLAEVMVKGMSRPIVGDPTVWCYSSREASTTGAFFGELSKSGFICHVVLALSI